MQHATFNDIYNSGQLVLENELFKHYHNSLMPLMYDSNYIAFNKLPSMTEFIKSSSYLKEFHLKKKQNHLRFTFPPNKNLSVALINYLQDEGYAIGHNMLYAIYPHHFLFVDELLGLDIEVVTTKNLDRYLSLQYFQDFSYGIEFAKQKGVDYQKRFQDQSIYQLLAVYQDRPVGSVDVIVTHKTAEIDNLFVDNTYQRRGIGSLLQKKVMEMFSDKLIILVADGNDSPKEMYKKQNYQFLEFKYEALKV